MQQSGRNLGKKYKKLTGEEIATAASEARGKRFIDWYGALYRVDRRLRDLDPEVVAETIIEVYNDIVYKDKQVRKYKHYFMCAYRTNALKRNIKERKHIENYPLIEEVHEAIPYDDFDSEAYEACADALCADILDYVRANYKPREVSLFEIYTGLHPDVSYEALSAMLGISTSLISNTISAIKKDLCLKYAEKRLILLSLL